MAKKLISYDDEAEGLGLPDAVEGKLAEVFAPIGDYAPASGSTVYATKDEITAVPENVVTSPQGVTLILTEDPNYVHPEGNALIFLFENETEFVNFTTLAAIGDLTSLGWSQPWVQSEWLMTDDGLQKPSGGTVRRAYANSASERDAEVLIRVQGSGSALPSSLGMSAAARVSGAETTETGIVAGIVTESGAPVLQVSEYRNGTYADLASVPVANYVSGQWRWVRLRVEGSMAHAKSWVDGEVEPTEWMVSSAATVTTPGGAGVAAPNALNQTFSQFSVSYGGTAPKAE